MDTAARLARLEGLAHRMDTLFRIPVIGLRVGYDAIVGLVPVVGDLLTLVPSLFIINEARRMGAPSHLVGRMMANTLTEGLIGMVPVLGDLFDAKFKANRRNVAMLRSHLERKGAVPVGQPQFA
ncbi:protein of unknown function [Loktanella fryxellensis]|uniref:DUF4112 domain-containing protein n=1 Tax=Loktanella fryxellensis TaxID=245187 RepID=A0A1H8F670_9RHOB|nr:DUF4112 domain-containing protein [Loktanella fryxellensis]SEN27155.1 protein of unknown function [Loktanella fryxellensis]